MCEEGGAVNGLSGEVSFRKSEGFEDSGRKAQVARAASTKAPHEGTSPVNFQEITRPMCGFSEWDLGQKENG